MSIKKYIVPLIPKPLQRLNRYYRKLNVPSRRRAEKRMVAAIRARGHANVVFMASTMGMWRYEEVAQALQRDPRFSVLVVIHPFKTYSEEEKQKEAERLRTHFEASGLRYVVCGENGFTAIKQEFKPDIIFYAQPYGGEYGDDIEWRQNLDLLQCYIPYCLHLAAISWTVDNDMQNLLWRHYVAYPYHKEIAGKVALNRAKNAMAVGEPRADELRTPPVSDPWKPMADGRPRKRLIWAPHFQVLPNAALYRPEFLWMAQPMLELAKKYAGELQIAFKPHPRLRTKLYTLPDWGKERTDAYYAEWENLANTQLEAGEYTDLFKTSDAMIHNSGSFIAEYVFTNKPIGFVTDDLAQVTEPFHKFGHRCMDCHYILHNMDEVRWFIEQVVMGGEDPMNETRRQMCDTELQPVDGNTVAQNVYNDFVKSLFE